MPIREKLIKRAAKAGVSLPPAVADGLTAYFELLRKWNRKVSLTALPVEEGGDEAVDRLLIEPVLASRYLSSNHLALLDIGSGGGSPAIPMKLVSPAMSLRMVESKTRKAAFLREVTRTLGLEGAETEAVRSEELLSRPALHDAADVVTMRAVRVRPGTLVELQTFIKPNGFLFLFGTGVPGASIQGSNLIPHASHILLSQWGSRLEILRKTGEK